MNEHEKSGRLAGRCTTLRQRLLEEQATEALASIEPTTSNPTTPPSTQDLPSQDRAIPGAGAQIVPGAPACPRVPLLDPANGHDPTRGDGSSCGHDPSCGRCSAGNSQMPQAVQAPRQKKERRSPGWEPLIAVGLIASLLGGSIVLVR